jgi:hypothetical protein
MPADLAQRNSYQGICHASAHRNGCIGRLAATILSIYLAIGSMANRADDAGLDDGVVRVRSVYPFPETVERLIASITASVAAN